MQVYGICYYNYCKPQMLKKPREQINGGESDIKLRLMNWKIDSEYIDRVEVSKTHKNTGCICKN